MDKKTNEYFKWSARNREVNRSDSCSFKYRRDLQSAYESRYGRHIRNFYGYRNTEKMERAIAQCALWCLWKESQTGRPVNFGDIPDYVKPCLTLPKHNC